MKIITKELHSRLRLEYGHDSLFHWLCLNAAQSLNSIVSVLGKQKPVVTAAAAAPVPPVEEKLSDDDEWDKEDIDEIQGEDCCSCFVIALITTLYNKGQRIVDEDVDLDNLFGKRKQEPKSKTTASPAGDVRFAFTIARLEEEYWLKMKERDELEEGQDRRELDRTLLDMESRLKSIAKLLEITPPLDAGELRRLMASEYLCELPSLQRWKMYCAWKSLVVDILEERAIKIEAEYRSQARELKDVETTETAEIIRSADVVGITTTGAAKQKALLEHLRSKIGWLFFNQSFL